MVTTEPIPLPDLPTQVGRVLTDFVSAAQTAFANDLCAVVLFGTHGRLTHARINPTVVWCPRDLNVSYMVADYMSIILS